MVEEVLDNCLAMYYDDEDMYNIVRYMRNEIVDNLGYSEDIFSMHYDKFINEWIGD